MRSGSYLGKILGSDHADAYGEVLAEDGGEVEEQHEQHEIIAEARAGVHGGDPLAEVDVPNRDEERRAKGAEKVAPATVVSSQGLC